MSTKVLVTGGTGFIGSYIVEQLIKEGYTPVVYDLFPISPDGEVAYRFNQLGLQCEFIKGDIGDLASLMNAVKDSEADAIVHTAALTDVHLLEQSPLQSLRINTIGSINALEAARIFGLKRVVFTSSIAVYAPKQYEPMDEAHPVLLPDKGPALSTYSTAKLSAEAFGMHYWQQYQLSFVGLRFSGVYGFGMKYPMYIKPMVESAVNGLPYEIDRGGEAKRDFVYVRDVAQAAVKAIKAEEHDLKQRIFNIANGGSMTNVFQLADKVRKQIPAADLKVGPGLTDYEAQVDKSRGELSIDHAVEQLQHRPQYDLEKGIAEYISLYGDYIKSKKGV